jgi:hypothetical protein
MPVTRLWHSKKYVSVATVVNATIENVGDCRCSLMQLCRGYIWKTETDEESVEEGVISSLQMGQKQVLASVGQWRPDMAKSQWPGVAAMKVELLDRRQPTGTGALERGN